MPETTWSGGDESTIITGSSVHNERIEHLWRDISRSVVVAFKHIFTSLEEQKSWMLTMK